MATAGSTMQRAVAMVACIGLALALHAGPVLAKKKDPALVCAGAKHVAGGKFCGAVLRAWARFDKHGDAARRDAAIANARATLDARWAKADQKSAAAGTDCALPTATSTATAANVDSASGAFVGEVNTGLDLGDGDQAKCGARILRAAAAKCQALLATEGAYQRARTKPQSAATRAAGIAAVRSHFTNAFIKATATGCPTRATIAGSEARVDAIVTNVVHDILSSPGAGSGDFIGIDATDTTYQGRMLTPKCLNGTPYEFWARRGTVNRLLVYYQGGGACWEQLTCSLPTCDTTVTDGDNPALATTGFADLANPANPFRDWSVVFVSYCSCDIHFGDAAQDYANSDPMMPKHVEHRGYQNARVVEKWAREHFLAPEEVFVTGSSAGAYGAWFNAPLHARVWPSSHVDVLADAGNGVVTPDFLQTFFPNWNFEANLPADIPELKQVLDSGAGIRGYTQVIAAKFPKANWANYSTAFDGGSGGQTGFYNLMLHGNDPLTALTWWEGSCQFRTAMRNQALDISAVVDASTGNYRYYLGSGSRHTMWGSDKVYTDTTGGVPTIVSWVNAMLASAPGRADPAWTDVEANPENVLLPDDPQPDPLLAPFVMSGADVVVDCGAP